MKIDIVVGARPNFMKIAHIIEAIEKAASDGKNISYRLIYTGQDYDRKMEERLRGLWKFWGRWNLN